MMKEYKGIIYKYTSPSGKIYIGQTIRPKKRRSEHHFSSLNKPDIVFHKAIKKYGWENFSYTVLVTIICSTKEVLKSTLNYFEQSFIKEYNSIIPNGYNQSLGGIGPIGYKHTLEERMKISKSHIGLLHTEEEKRKIASANTGIIFTKERKEKISRARSIPIIQLSLEGKFIKEYPSAKVAAEILHLNRTNITACCRHKPKHLTVGNYKWIYKKEYYECYLQPIKDFR